MPPRLAVPVALVTLAGLLAGCGGTTIKTDGSRTGTIRGKAIQLPGSAAPLGASARSCETLAVDAEDLRATGLSCGQARRVMYGWQRARSCASLAGASRASCAIRSYRCLAAKTGRGIAVSCARPGRSVAFLATRG